MNAAFIGVGNMASALIDAYLAKEQSNTSQDKSINILFITDKQKNCTNKYMGMNRVSVAECAVDAANNADIIFICVKPNQMHNTVHELGEAIHNKAVVSIAAGWTRSALKTLMPKSRLMRVMPNTPAMVGMGVIAISSDCDFTPVENEAVGNFFSVSGIIEYVQEQHMDAITAVSGGGPAYTLLFIEAITDAAVREGLPRDIARRIACQTVLGAAALAQKGSHTAMLKDAVLSPSGTTIEAIAHLERMAVRGSIIDAVHYAAERSRSLSKDGIL